VRNGEATRILELDGKEEGSRHVDALNSGTSCVCPAGVMSVVQKPDRSIRLAVEEIQVCCRTKNPATSIGLLVGGNVSLSVIVMVTVELPPR